MVTVSKCTKHKNVIHPHLAAYCHICGNTLIECKPEIYKKEVICTIKMLLEGREPMGKQTFCSLKDTLDIVIDNSTFYGNDMQDEVYISVDKIEILRV